jgi:hypothetical protein
MRSANVFMLIAITLSYLLVAIYYCLIKLKIKKIENAKNINELDKGTLRYLEKYNFSKSIILSEISKKINHMKTGIISMQKMMVIAFIFILLHFMLKSIDVLMKVNNFGKIFLDIQIDCILITLLLVSLCFVLLIKITQKYINLLLEQLARLL